MKYPCLPKHKTNNDKLGIAYDKKNKLSIDEYSNSKS